MTIVEIFSINNLKNEIRWTSNHLNKEYDNLAKSYIIAFKSNNYLETNDKNKLNPHQHIIFQIYFDSKNYSIFEFNVCDVNGMNKRIILSSSISEIINHEMHARIPFTSFPIEKWINLEIDLQSLCNYFQKTVSIKNLNGIKIQFEGKLKKICLAKDNLKGYILKNQALPKILKMPFQVEIENVVLRLNNLNTNTITTNTNSNTNINTNLNFNLNSDINSNYNTIEGKLNDNENNILFEINKKNGFKNHNKKYLPPINKKNEKLGKSSKKYDSDKIHQDILPGIYNHDKNVLKSKLSNNVSNKNLHIVDKKRNELKSNGQLNFDKDFNFNNTLTKVNYNSKEGNNKNNSDNYNLKNKKNLLNTLSIDNEKEVNLFENNNKIFKKNDFIIEEESGNNSRIVSKLDFSLFEKNMKNVVSHNNSKIHKLAKINEKNTKAENYKLNMNKNDNPNTSKLKNVNENSNNITNNYVNTEIKNELMKELDLTNQIQDKSNSNDSLYLEHYFKKNISFYSPPIVD